MAPPSQRTTANIARVTHDRQYSNPRMRVTLDPADTNDVFCTFLLVVAVVYLVLICVGPFFTPMCKLQPPEGKKWKNPDYDGDPCLDQKLVVLGGLSLREAGMARNLYMSLLLGFLIGYERKGPDRPAGIRTMSLASIGACIFTISSNFAFQGGPMAWDSSRVTADIAKGFGFFAGAVIWKGMVRSETLGKEIQQAHGLTTATGTWLAAAVGAACGGGMLSVAAATVAFVVLMLRFGPRNAHLVLQRDEDEEALLPAILEGDDTHEEHD